MTHDTRSWWFVTDFRYRKKKYEEEGLRICISMCSEWHIMCGNKNCWPITHHCCVSSSRTVWQHVLWAFCKSMKWIKAPIWMLWPTWLFPAAKKMKAARSIHHTSLCLHNVISVNETKSISRNISLVFWYLCLRFIFASRKLTTIFLFIINAKSKCVGFIGKSWCRAEMRAIFTVRTFYVASLIYSFRTNGTKIL